VCGHLLEQTQPATNHAVAVSDVVSAIVSRYSKTPLVMKTVLQVRCCTPLEASPARLPCAKPSRPLDARCQTLSNSVYDHEQLLESFKIASVSLSPRELLAVVLFPEAHFRCLALFTIILSLADSKQ
jgi:hypothetical protein